MKQKLLCVLLALVLCLSLVPAGALAAGEAAPSSDDTGGNAGSVSWGLSEDGVLTVSGSGPVEAPYGWQDVANKEAVRRIVVGGGITGIGEQAFAGFMGAESVIIPAGVLSLGEGAFGTCASLRDIELPDGLAAIPAHAFEGCAALERVYIPVSVTEIGFHAFADCTALKTAEYPGTEEQWDAVSVAEGNAALLKARGISAGGNDAAGIEWSFTPDGVLTVSGTGEVTFSGRDSLDRYVYPWTDYSGQVTAIVVEEGVTGLGWAAFSNFWRAESVRLPGSLTYIGPAAFAGCGLRTLALPAGVEDIAEGAFSGCDSLERVDYPGTEEQWDAIYIAEGNETLLYVRNGSVSGQSGHMRWTLDEDGVLTVSCSGDAGHIDGLIGLRSRIRTVRLAEGVTGIDGVLLGRCGNLTALELPATIRAVSGTSFEECYALTDIRYSGTERDWQAVDFDPNDEAFRGVTVHYAAGEADAETAEATEAADWLEAGLPMEAVRVLQRLVGLTGGSPARALAESLIGSGVEELFAAIGMPESAEYSESCLVPIPGAQDGLLYYDGFTVETILYPSGAERVYDVF